MSASEPPKPDRAVIVHFLNEVALGRGDCINDIVYLVFNARERQLFPELAECFGIALEISMDDNRSPHSCLFRTEAEFDDDVLAALAMTGSASRQPIV